jgi:DNA repair exonuclease SbcCD ATPase subunit
MDFDKCNGVVVVESDPPNFGGKTVLSVDLLLFLFFNETTKTTKAEEIFNRFTDKDSVVVKGEVTIDGEDYIILRKIERKLSKKGEWNVKTELDFFKKMADGSLLNFTGEQRRETEAFIKNSIGTKEDFLMTILTTATNLEELLESKPTARGQVLSRFMGLEFLKRKEEVGKEIYSEFNKSKMSNIYNSEELKGDNESLTTKIGELNDQIDLIKLELKDIDDKIVKGKEYRDDMLKKKHGDIDKEISLMNPVKTQEEIDGFDREKTTFQQKLDELNVFEPKEFYHEDDHDKIKEEYNDVFKSKIELETQIKEEEAKERIYKIYMEAFGKNGLSKIIMKTMMPLINSELQRLMEDSCYFKLVININDKNDVEFLMIDNSTGIEKLMVSGSGYERTIASLALRSVLSKVCTLPKPNIVVLDEVFGKISNDNLEMVSEFFQKIKEYFDKVFLISHNPMISQWSDTIVKIKKENNISKVL